MRSNYEDAWVFAPHNEEAQRQYLVQRRLGAGTYGVVHLAVDVLDPKVVALKIANSAEGNEPGGAISEMEVANWEPHPNRVKMYQSFIGTVALSELRNPGHCKELFNEPHGIMSIEYCPRGSFARLGKDPSRVRAAAWLKLYADVARGVQSVHHQGYLHTDIKPENALIGPQNTGKIADFGNLHPYRTAGEKQNPDPSGVSYGTLQYMGPEHLLQNKPVDTSDVFSLAISLGESLTGQRPYNAATPEGYAAMYNALEEPQLLPFQASAELEIIGDGILPALSLNPARRPSIGEFIEKLQKMRSDLAQKERKSPHAKPTLPGAHRGHLDNPLMSAKI